MKDLSKIVEDFNTQGTIKAIKPLGGGLINDTYKVETTEPNSPDYVLQRINHTIFQNIEMLQTNIEAVTRHIRKKLTEAEETDIDRKVLTFLETAEGKTYSFDGENYWRMMTFIPHAHTYETVNPEYSYYAGVAFGNFQAMLADIPDTLGETIPDFHNMEFRLQQLREAVDADAVGRVAEVQYYLDEIANRAGEMCKAEQLHREGKLPKRVCHCDTKVNNMMFDDEGKVLCVIDLDTVMPSYIFSDYGDFLRTGANTGDEDDKDLNRVNFNMEIFKAFTKGYLEGANSFLTPLEIENLPYAAALFPYMQCVRFLADYINGDTYYKTSSSDHNLIRTQAQFKLLQSVEEHTEDMKAFISECLNRGQ
ncbi:phosphotransferase enzyme family protein [Bacteroides reticulotermitis]|uniref:phosphotransferase enzyme family protein n=1 Tax=Bacteroides reticulotermitis TaxID=1133319 RepID=UPI003A8466B0